MWYVTPPLSVINQEATVRLFPTKYYKSPVLKPLVYDESDKSAIVQIKSLSYERVNNNLSDITSSENRKLALKSWGQTLINNTFKYTRPEGNRFNSAEEGAWYASFDDLTAIAEVAYHRTRELEAIKIFQDEVVYQALLARICGEFHDLRQVNSKEPFLGKDSATAYPFGQQLASQLRQEDSLGLIYPSQRMAGGTNIAVFNSKSINNLRPGSRWKIIWDNSLDYTVTTDFGDEQMTL